MMRKEGESSMRTTMMPFRRLPFNSCFITEDSRGVPAVFKRAPCRLVVVGRPTGFDRIHWRVEEGEYELLPDDYEVALLDDSIVPWTDAILNA